MSLFANAAGIDYRRCPDYQSYVQDVGTLKVTEVRSEDGCTADTAELGGWEQAMNKIENAPQVCCLAARLGGSFALQRYGKRGMEQSKLFEDVAAAWVVGAAIESAVWAVAEDEGATASWAFAGGNGGVAPLFVGAYVVDVNLAFVFGVAVGFNETVVDAGNLGVG